MKKIIEYVLEWLSRQDERRLLLMVVALIAVLLAIAIVLSQWPTGP